MRGSLRICTDDDGDFYQTLTSLGGGTISKHGTLLDDVVIYIEFYSIRDLYEKLGDIYCFLKEKFKQ